MTDQQHRIRDAIADIDGALKDHRNFGPHYNEKELKEIAAERDKLLRRLQLTEEREAKK